MLPSKILSILPNPGTNKFNTKHNVANGIGKIGMAALTGESFTINFGSIASVRQHSTIFKGRLGFLLLI